MNNVVMRKITITTAYQALASVKTVCTFTLSTPPGNTGNVMFVGDTGDEVEMIPGEWHTFQSVDLNGMQVKGTAGDILTVIGGTW